MQTLTLQFHQSLRNAIFADACNSALIANGNGAPGKSAENAKLAATEAEQDAKSLLRLKQVAVDLCAQLEQQIEKLDASRALTMTEFADLAIQLAMEVASAVVRYEVTHHEIRIRKLVEEFIERFEPSSQIVVYVNKIDLAKLRSELEDHDGLKASIQWKLDDSLAQGDVRIESPEQRVIAGCQQQMVDIQTQLMECLHHARFESNPT